MSDREARIRAKAHYLWLSEGCPDGRELEHWQRATELVDGDGQGGQPASESFPPAGPHAKPALADEATTAGTGMLPPVGSDDPDQQPSG